MPLELKQIAIASINLQTNCIATCRGYIQMPCALCTTKYNNYTVFNTVYQEFGLVTFY